MADSYLLQENGDFLLQEDNSKIILDEIVAGAVIHMFAMLGVGA